MAGTIGIRQVSILLAFAVVGWAFCGAIMGVGPLFLSMQTTLIVHAIAGPLGFALLALIYHRRFAYTGPLLTALVFLGVVIGLDLFLVAPLFIRSYAMFGSIIGTWLPFSLIFAATLVTGITVRNGGTPAERNGSDRAPRA